MLTSSPASAFRILIVENDADLLGLLVDDLRDAGYMIDIAEDSLEAATRLGMQAIDLMVTDLDAPGMAGNTVRVIGDLFPWMPVITLGGSHDEGDAAVDSAGHASRHLDKPVHLHELRNMITSVLDARSDLERDNMGGWL